MSRDFLCRAHLCSKGLHEGLLGGRHVQQAPPGTSKMRKRMKSDEIAMAMTVCDSLGLISGTSSDAPQELGQLLPRPLPLGQGLDIRSALANGTPRGIVEQAHARRAPPNAARCPHTPQVH